MGLCFPHRLPALCVLSITKLSGKYYVPMVTVLDRGEKVAAMQLSWRAWEHSYWGLLTCELEHVGF